MTEESAKLRIPYIAAAQAQKHVTHNEAMTLLDTLVQLSVLDKDLLAPPGSPAEGDCYIVAGGGGTAAGAWAGWEMRVARYIDGAWRSYLPGQGNGAGWIAWIQDEDAMYRFDGAGWTLAGIEGPQGPQGPAYQPDAAVDDIAGRSTYDGEAASFSVLVVSDSGNAGQPTLYFKLSAASADWSTGITWLPQNAGPAFIVRVATTVDIAIPATLNSGDVIDGVALVGGDLVLVKDQATAGENGIYIVGASPARANGLAVYDQHPGVLVTVQEGTANADTVWQCTSDKGGTLGPTAIAFVRLIKAGESLGPKNAVINGGFDVWQEATSFPGAAAGVSRHVCDGFYCLSAGAAAASIARSTSVRAGARTRYCAEITGAAGVTTVSFGQAVESADAARLKRQVTFSCYIYNNSGAAFTPLIFGHTPTAQDNYTATNTVINGVSLSQCANGTWTRVTYSFDASGFTGIDNGLAIEVQIPSGSLAAADTVRLAEWQLEEGEVLAPLYSGEPFDQTLRACQRRLVVLTTRYYVAGADSAFSINRGVVDFDEMRDIPAVGLISGGIEGHIGAATLPSIHSVSVTQLTLQYSGGNFRNYSALASVSGILDARLKR